MFHADWSDFACHETQPYCTELAQLIQEIEDTVKITIELQHIGWPVAADTGAAATTDGGRGSSQGV
ncbi:MAG TPA: hypothetical protein PLP17_04370 [Oligoflexia bacterium]|nr:hypothetical protein [Oligoflexia bacterium]